ncbi:phage tail terminator-like protein [Aureimonas sp. ME7]|uniref:phage tail terminator-like protein n=1 Tax=Aureimonas sp. ME7 TaxID=2744252 RepID=UPI0015FE6F55|nr:phage tail terminator-like protein [Aureimonas sp. ME7]
MAHSLVVETIDAHVRASFEHCPVLAEDDNGESPADLGPFLVVAYPYSRSEQETVGDGADFEEEGAFTLTLAVPRGFGVRQARSWLDGMAVTLRAKQIGPVWCAAPQPAVLDDDRSDQAYVRLIMAVPYRFLLEG